MMLRSFIAGVLLVLATGYLQAEPSRTFWNEKEQVIGTATTTNNSVTVFRDANGLRTGTAVQQGNTTIFYDNQGQRTGTATRR